MNFFVTAECTKKLQVMVEDMTLLVKVNFVQRSCKMAQTDRNMRFKMNTSKF